MVRVRDSESIGPPCPNWRRILTLKPGMYRAEALCRRQLSVTVRGTTHHLIAYFDMEALMYATLRRPSTSPELIDIVPRSALSNQSFAIPVEIDDRLEILRVLGT